MSEDLENSGFPADQQQGPDAPQESGDSPLRAHAAHHRFQKSSPGDGPNEPIAASSAAMAPSICLHPDSPEVLEKLEALDDAVYDAINGSTPALECLKNLWPTTLAGLGETLVADSREQYLRYALSIWEQCVEHPGHF